MSKLTILVTGATGQQGGALARKLLAKGHNVRALTRDPGSPAAKALAEAGAQLVTGDFQDPASLTEAAKGANGVFAVGTPYEAGAEVEIKQSIAVVDAAVAAGVNHLVYTSVAGADASTGIPHFDSKAKVEDYIRAQGIPYTIIAPVYFMDNAVSQWVLPGLQQGNLAVALPESTRLQQVAVEDIGAFGAHVFENPKQFAGQRIELASDEISGTEAAQTLAEAAGRPINYYQVPIEQVAQMSDDMAKMYEWFQNTGYSADIKGLRQNYPEVGWTNYSDWAKGQDWSVLDAAPEHAPDQAA